MSSRLIVPSFPLTYTTGTNRTNRLSIFLLLKQMGLHYLPLSFFHTAVLNCCYLLWELIDKYVWWSADCILAPYSALAVKQAGAVSIPWVRGGKKWHICHRGYISFCACYWQQRTVSGIRVMTQKRHSPLLLFPLFLYDGKGWTGKRQKRSIFSQPLHRNAGDRDTPHPLQDCNHSKLCVAMYRCTTRTSKWHA